MIKNLFYSALIVGGLAVCAYAKPMDAEAAKKIPELRQVLISVHQQGQLSDQDRVVVERNLASGDPVLVSLAACVVAESKETETDFCAKAKDALDKASAMPQAYIRLMLTKKKADALEPLLKDPNPYLRVEAAKEVLKTDSHKGEQALETMMSDDSDIVKGEAFRQLRKRGKTGGFVPAPMTDERYELLLSIIEKATGVLDTRQLLSAQPMERSRALEGLTAKYREVCAAHLKTLDEAKAKFRTDRRYRSPLHAAILAVDAWRVLDADELLLSIVDYELDPSSLPLGMNVLGDYFYPAASALVHLRVDMAKVERALEAAENPKTRKILTWVLLERGKDIEKVKKALADASAKSHGVTEKQNIDKALELLNKPSELLPMPSRGNQRFSAQSIERSRALEESAARYREVCAALLKTLEKANAQFITDRRYHSPLHAAILAVDAWQVTNAEDNLLSMVDYELDITSLPDGMDVPGDYFYPAARTLVHLRVDTAKVERALEAAENPKTRRILTWVLLERGKDIEKVKKALADASGKSHGVTEKQNIDKALELLNKPSELLPMPSRGNHPSSK